MSRGRECFDQCPNILGHTLSKILDFPSATNYMFNIFWFFFINLRYDWKDSCKKIINKHGVLNLIWLFLNLNWFICKQRPVLFA